MRIISGQYKGRKISLPNDNKTRPLKDMVKESIFNVIEHSNKINLSIKNSIILDLFSGSGSFGLEAISRGAANVVFVENYSNVMQVLKKNINLLNCNKKCKLLNTDCFKYFVSSEKLNENYDIIFLDPPYKEKKINLLIEKILEKKILKKNGLIIIHRHKKDDIDLTNKLRIIDTRFYGISKIIFGL